MDLIPYDAEDAAAVESAVSIMREVVLADSPWERPPTTYRHTMSLRYGDGEPGRWFLLREDGADVGVVALHSSDHDNLELAWLSLAIRPSRRREGLGRRGLAVAAEESVRTGRPLLLLYGWDVPALRAFAAATGFEERSTEVTRAQEMSGTPDETERFVSLRAEAAARAQDYELVRFAGESPEELLAALARVTEAINDAPTDALEMEDERYDAARVRDYEHAMTASGFRFRRVIARHRETGEVVGHTVMVVDTEQPAWGEQHDTAVLPAHRGHRLGLLLKAEMLLWLAEEEPQLRHVLTGNAASNDVMIAVNERLGYRVAGRELLFQRRF
ncbi:MAG: GNAT family N-acetyltransferase [Nocardioidaceae bacterium]|nr:GNAT family N-acetyltransferase [Nocardioidaceae bacterium]